MSEDEESDLGEGENGEPKKQVQASNQISKMSKKGGVKRLLNIVPDNTSSMIVIPMNQHGDGYKISCYDQTYLKTRMSKGEFKYITTEFTKVTAIAYSENRIADIGQVPRKLIWMLVFAFILAACALMTLQLSLNSKQAGLEPSTTFLVVIISILAVSGGIAV